MLEALERPAGTPHFARVLEACGPFELQNTIGNADLLAWRASRRREKILSNGPCAFCTFDLQLKQTKWGLKACRGSKIGLVG